MFPSSKRLYRYIEGVARRHSSRLESTRRSPFWQNKAAAASGLNSTGRICDPDLLPGSSKTSQSHVGVWLCGLSRFDRCFVSAGVVVPFSVWGLGCCDSAGSQRRHGLATAVRRELSGLESVGATAGNFRVFDGLDCLGSLSMFLSFSSCIRAASAKNQKSTPHANWSPPTVAPCKNVGTLASQRSSGLWFFRVIGVWQSAVAREVEAWPAGTFARAMYTGLAKLIHGLLLPEYDCLPWLSFDGLGPLSRASAAGRVRNQESLSAFRSVLSEFRLLSPADRQQIQQVGAAKNSEFCIGESKIMVSDFRPGLNIRDFWIIWFLQLWRLHGRGSPKTLLSWP